MLLEGFPLPPLSLLSTISKVKIDAIKCVQALKKAGKTSDDICLLFGEMYLQLCEVYFGGEMIGSNENEELYKGIVCFIKVGFKEAIPHVIKSSPEITINVAWFRDKLIECLDVLYQCDFNVRVIVYDNHHPNVSTFTK